MACSTFNSRKAVTWRSGLEKTVMDDLTARGAVYRYEEDKVAYTKPVTHHTYTPDFVLENGIVVETKGLFDVDDRKKHDLVKAQHPDLDIRFVFTRSKTPIRKGSPTTYAIWCEKRGILYADKLIPSAWLEEPNDPLRHAALKAAQSPK